MNEIGIVIIGRNEGARLVRCLQSIGPDYPIVYVDSGSSDGSTTVGLQHSARIVELDMASPFTAARARNAGLAALAEQCSLIQFVDGDCTLQPGWLEKAAAALTQDAGLAAAFGRRREIVPGASLYNWMCDLEWSVTPGPTRYFGGDVMLRRSALVEAGGYPATMIAGEEPDLAIRLRERGWRLVCLPYEMTLHDANITHFGQWWRRSIRSGHAYGELAARHVDGAFSDYRRRLMGVLLWGGVVPLAAVAMLLLGAVVDNVAPAVAAGIVLLVPLAQLARLSLRGAVRYGWRRAILLATFVMIAKPAQTIGFVRYCRARLAGTRSQIIEYKGSAA